MKTRWNNAPGYITAYVYKVDGRWMDEDREKVLTDGVATWLNSIFPDNIGGVDLLIDFQSSGYYDPGRISGPPESCYPPGGGGRTRSHAGDGRVDGG